MIPPPLLTELEEDEEKDLKKWGGWGDGWMDGSLNGVISRAPVHYGRLLALSTVHKQKHGSPNSKIAVTLT